MQLNNPTLGHTVFMPLGSILVPYISWGKFWNLDFAECQRYEIEMFWRDSYFYKRIQT
jgi:hypothetical protein